MSLLRDVVRILSERGVRHALIGAASLAAHGVARATADLDLLAVDPACLAHTLWAPLRSAGVEVTVRRGDDADPLAGVVRIRAKGDPTVDVIVGKAAWQADVLQRASPTRVGDARVPVVSAADLVLLKLYAGGPQDAWDVDQLLDAGADIRGEIESRLSQLPPECATLWRRILAQRGEAG